MSIVETYDTDAGAPASGYSVRCQKLYSKVEGFFMIYGYARVSSKGQERNGYSLEAQEEQLKLAGAEIVYSDSFTGTKMERPEFNKLLLILQAGDTLIVCKLDRFARSVSKATDLITELIDRGITINVLNLGILDNSSMSVFMRNILLAFAQLERDMILERTQEGKAVARQKAGFRDGRPRKFSQKKIEAALGLLKTMSYRQVEELTGISKSTLIRAKKKLSDS